MGVKQTTIVEYTCDDCEITLEKHDVFPGSDSMVAWHSHERGETPTDIKLKGLAAQCKIGLFLDIPKEMRNPDEQFGPVICKPCAARLLRQYADTLLEGWSKGAQQ